MTNWTSICEVKARLQKDWEKGRFLRAYLTGEDLFPLRISLKHPSGSKLNENFAEVRIWAETLVNELPGQGQAGITLEYQEVVNRVVGRNQIPVAVQVADLPALLRYIKCETSFKKFESACRQVLSLFAELREWLAANPFTVIENSENWSRLLSVCSWLLAHPKPEIYLRQLDLPGIDTKFIETHRKVLSELLDTVLPPESINAGARGVSGFEARYGFYTRPVQVRFRILDASMAIAGLTDLQIRIDEFARLQLPLQKVFVTENEINGLVFPEVAGAIVIFGLGYGLDRLSGIDWLKQLNIIYWGDIDTHGFAMLDQMRSYFSQTKSMLMNRDTLLSHRQFWGFEPKQTARELPRLDATESALYQDLLTGTCAPSLRLEQERISYSIVLNTIRQS
ncbi:MAG: hypothetical protein GQF41_1929 [Candidatus Rifleibacterium amylolyticum]|nr:MAG: hypothetical protein GQF41_1929 [Candidatus Rifleibacterium amylolyticum]